MKKLREGVLSISLLESIFAEFPYFLNFASASNYMNKEDVYVNYAEK